MFQINIIVGLYAYIFLEIAYFSVIFYKLRLRTASDPAGIFVLCIRIHIDLLSWIRICCGGSFINLTHLGLR